MIAEGAAFQWREAQNGEASFTLVQAGRVCSDDFTSRDASVRECIVLGALAKRVQA